MSQKLWPSALLANLACISEGEQDFQGTFYKVSIQMSPYYKIYPFCFPVENTTGIQEAEPLRGSVTVIEAWLCLSQDVSATALATSAILQKFTSICSLSPVDTVVFSEARINLLTFS